MPVIFELLSSKYYADRCYTKGERVVSDVDLRVNFPNMFRKISTSFEDAFVKSPLVLVTSHSLNNLELALLTLPNRVRYATKHGYDILRLVRPYGDGDAGAFAHSRMLLDFYEVVVWIGSDIIITNFDKPIKDFADPSVAVILSGQDMVFGPRNSYINADILLWNSNDHARNLLDELILREPRFRNKRWGLQSELNEMLQEGGRKDIKVIPLRQLQSLPHRGHPMQWEEGDFAIHFLGQPEEWKLMGCKKFIIEHQVLWRDEWQKGIRYEGIP